MIAQDFQGIPIVVGGGDGSGVEGGVKKERKREREKEKQKETKRKRKREKERERKKKTCKNIDRCLIIPGSNLFTP